MAARRLAPALAVALALIAPAASGAAIRTAAGIAPDIPTGGQPPRVPRARVAEVLNPGGGPVLHANRTHLIFWAPARSGLSFESGYETLVETFLSQVAADSRLPSNVFGLTGQYADAVGPAAYDSTYAGAIIDTNGLPPNGCTEPRSPLLGGAGPDWPVCITDQQLQAELIREVTARHLPTSPNDVYLLLTPKGLGNCFGAGPDNCALGGATNSGYCGYHQSTETGDILYGVIPYNAVGGHCQSDNPRPNASPADPAISTVAHELAEIVTDPLGTAWLDSNQNEIADLCISDYGPPLGGSGGSTAYDEQIHGGRYFIQELWSNADGRCMPAARADAVSLSIPRRVLGDRSLPVTGEGQAAHGAITAYSWSFGDRRGGSGRRVSHAYTRAGRFTVRLRTTDSWGNWAFASRAVTVTVPPAPVTHITGAPGRFTRLSHVRFRFTSDAAMASFRCRVDRRAWTRCGSPFSTSPLAPGPHAFLVQARDTFGRLGRLAAVYRFTVT
jgi:hypothetical protein